MEDLGIIETAAEVAGVILLAAMGLALVRLVRGPDLPDRAVALDLISLLAVGFAGVAAVATGRGALLDVGIALALVAFLSTLAFAWYVERRTAGKAAGEGGSPPWEAS